MASQQDLQSEYNSVHTFRHTSHLNDTRLIWLSCKCRASEGIVRLNVEHVPLAAPGLDSEARVSGVYATELASQLDKAIHNARAIDLEALCIMAGQKVSDTVH